MNVTVYHVDSQETVVAEDRWCGGGTMVWYILAKAFEPDGASRLRDYPILSVTYSGHGIVQLVKTHNNSQNQFSDDNKIYTHGVLGEDYL